MNIAPVAQDEMQLTVPTHLDFVGAFQLNLSGVDIDKPIQLAIPAPSGATTGETVYFFRHAVFPDENGVNTPVWLLVESGVVGADGFIRTTSPPYPGIVADGEYMMAKSIQGSTAAVLAVSSLATFTSLAMLTGVGAPVAMRIG